ncbi:MAG: hypothetical protein AVDCRST_MAG66-2055, partial [uncultured Pseudonocardia sp.]
GPRPRPVRHRRADRGAAGRPAAGRFRSRRRTRVRRLHQPARGPARARLRQRGAAGAARRRRRRRRLRAARPPDDHRGDADPDVERLLADGRPDRHVDEHADEHRADEHRADEPADELPGRHLRGRPRHRARSLPHPGRLEQLLLGAPLGEQRPARRDHRQRQRERTELGHRRAVGPVRAVQRPVPLDARRRDADGPERATAHVHQRSRPHVVHRRPRLPGLPHPGPGAGRARGRPDRPRRARRRQRRDRLRGAVRHGGAAGRGGAERRRRDRGAPEDV